MRLVKLITAVLVAMPLAVPAVEAAKLNAEGMEVLYDTEPWSVFRNPEGPVCDARVLTKDRLFELSAIKDSAVLNIAGKEWNYDAHTAMVHVVAREASGFGMTALYQGFSVRTVGNAKALYLEMEMLGENVETLNVKDDKLTTIASFPVAGMTKALAAWKACLDGL
jgi:hypothetical protein